MNFAITLDLAQIVVLGGLIWNLSQMNSTVKQLGTITEKLTENLKELDKAHTKTAADVRVLTDRDNQRRDRRHDDRRDEAQ